MSEKSVTTRVNSRPLSSVSVNVTILHEEVQKEYQQILKTVQKQGKVDGFRPGKVPLPIVIKKYGEAISQETVQKIVEKYIPLIFEEDKDLPQPLSSPTLIEEPQLDPDKDFSFEIKYDIRPTINTPPIENITVVEDIVTIDAEDVEKELKKYQSQHSSVTEKDTTIVQKGDVVTATFVLFDTAEPPNMQNERKDFVCVAGEPEVPYNCSDDLIGLEKNKDYSFEKILTEEKNAQAQRVSVHISKISELDLPELDDEFAQDISEEYKNLEDLKKSITTRLHTEAKQEITNYMIYSFLEAALKLCSFDVPLSLQQREFSERFSRLAAQYQQKPEQLIRNLNNTGISPESLRESWKKDIDHDLRHMLLIEQYIHDSSIEISDEDVEKHITDHNPDKENIVESYKQSGSFSYLKDKMRKDRLIEIILQKCQKKEGKKYTSLIKFRENIDKNMNSSNNNTAVEE